MKAILFDLDGTLVNTDVHHFVLWQAVLQELGITIDRAFYDERISGRQNELIVRDVFANLPFEEGMKIAALKEKRFREGNVAMERLGGLDRLLSWIRDRSLITAVVTNAPRENADFMLSALNLTDVFETSIAIEDVPQGKPDPAPYQLALQQLSLSPEDAIVFEDTVSGTLSAVGAGLVTIGMETTHDPQKLLEAGAAFTISDFTDAKLWDWLDRSAEIIASTTPVF
ncbi:MAG: HAD-IA family hydrolase [Cyanobacteria bacterium SID2]|nr:HAD-IA family hydrolase [Cyanobacteria bacterium SID2]MBP0006432.1 HAD-IA family hydrolase [Cyanobacteria bacterium SBC]